jgi:transposase-like protein
VPTVHSTGVEIPERAGTVDGSAPRIPACQLSLTAGVRQAEVARQLGVTAQAVSVWHARWQASGAEGLRSRGPSGPAPRLSDAQLAAVEQSLLEGAT